MFPDARRFAYGALVLGSLTLIGAGFAASRTVLPAGLRPAPAATSIVGSSTGSLLFVDNNGTTPFNTFGVLGVAGVGPESIGVLGYGANSTQANLALTGYDIGPGSVATTGYAAFPEPNTGPGSTATTGVFGIAPDGNGVMGQTSVQHGSQSNYESTYAGVIGVDATTNVGNNSGVIGETTNGLFGVEGISGNGGVGGVYGLATDGTGVWANSSSGDGMQAYSNSGSALYAFSNTGDGISATSNTAEGISVASGASTGVDAYSGGTFTRAVHAKGYVGLEGQSLNSGDYPLNLQNESGANIAYIDDSGQLYVHGVTTIAVARNGGVGQTFTPQSTMKTLEDFGTGTLVNGTGSVRLDPAFAQLIDGGGYEVFLTPEGDNRGLYIAQKTATSFLVRESQGGRSSLTFDYRIVGRQYAHANERASIAQTAAAFGGPKPDAVRPRPVPNRVQQRRATLASKATAGRNPYAMPPAVSGLMLNFGH